MAAYLRELLYPLIETEQGYILMNTRTDYDLMRLPVKMGQRCFSFQGARVFNSLKINANTAASLQSLKIFVATEHHLLTVLFIFF